MGIKEISDFRKIKKPKKMKIYDLHFLQIKTMKLHTIIANNWKNEHIIFIFSKNHLKTFIYIYILYI